MIDMNEPTAPFPYFGGKQRAINLVWPRFGNVDNYVEPFCGSLAILLGAPEMTMTVTLNDINGFIVNFWRAIKLDPEQVAAWADWPITEIDLEARHGWLVNRAERLRWSLEDPDYFDTKIAGWWVWGACAWIGSGWCLGNGPWISNGAHIINDRKLPHVGDVGMGINRKLPHIGDAGRGEFIRSWFESLSFKIREARIICGDWKRVLTPVVTIRHGITAVFLDPPYTADITKGLYAKEEAHSESIQNWCIDHGNDPNFRIILAGYAGEYDLPGWNIIGGKATNGGYGNSAGNQNHKRETLWISPHCINGELF